MGYLSRYFHLENTLVLFKMTRPVDYSANLLRNIHEGIEPPTVTGSTTLIQGSYQYYHYGCDGFSDKVRPYVKVVP
jgi:hypothetical protein